MGKKIAILATALCVVCTVGLLIVLVLVNWTPEFYRREIASGGEDRDVQVKRFLNRASQLAGDLRQQLRWEATFGEDEINAWLVSEFPDLVQRYASDRASWLHQPRVSLSSGEVHVGVTRKAGLVSSVIWVRARIWVTQPGTVAVRLCSVRVGVLPLPPATIIELITRAARRGRTPIQWRQMEGDPVALVNLGVRTSLKKLRHVEVSDGAIYVSGSEGELASRVDGIDASASR